MDSKDRFNLWVIVACAVMFAILIVAVFTNDTLEKKWAFEKGLCRTQFAGSQNSSWQTCNK